MSDAYERIPLGQILVDRGFISLRQLHDALDYQMRLPPGHHKPLGEALIDLDIIDRETIHRALNYQPNFEEEPIGRILVEEKVIEEWQLARALKEQFSSSGHKKKLGFVLINLGYATRESIEQGLRNYHKKQSPDTSVKFQQAARKTTKMESFDLSQILKDQNLLEEWQWAHVEHLIANGNSQPLGTLLVQLGYVTSKMIEKAFSEYFDKLS